MPITSFGREARANTTTAGNQGENGIAAQQGGGYVVVWTDNNALDESVSGIFMQRYDASGAVVGGETRVNTTTLSEQAKPSVTEFANGGFVVAWTSYSPDGSDTDVYFQQCDNAGSALGPETLANSMTSGAQYAPSLTELASGGFVITWQCNIGGNYDIYLRRFDASGSPIGTDTLVNTTVAYNQIEPKILSLDDGGFVVIWMESQKDGSNYRIYFQRYDNAGNPAGPEPEQIPTSATVKFNPSAPNSPMEALLLHGLRRTKTARAEGSISSASTMPATRPALRRAPIPTPPALSMSLRSRPCRMGDLRSYGRKAI